jgi:hypothetical protein
MPPLEELDALPDLVELSEKTETPPREKAAPISTRPTPEGIAAEGKPPQPQQPQLQGLVRERSLSRVLQRQKSLLMPNRASSARSLLETSDLASRELARRLTGSDYWEERKRRSITERGADEEQLNDSAPHMSSTGTPMRGGARASPGSPLAAEATRSTTTTTSTPTIAPPPAPAPVPAPVSAPVAPPPADAAGPRQLAATSSGRFLAPPAPAPAPAPAHAPAPASTSPPHRRSTEASRRRTSVGAASANDLASAEERASHLRRFKQWSSLGFLVVRIFGSTLLLHLLFSTIDWFSSYHGVCSASSGCRLMKSFVYFSVVYYALYIVCLVSGAILLRKVSENFKMTRELVLVMGLLVVCGISLISVYIAGHFKKNINVQIGQALIVFIGCVLGSFVSLVWPLYISFVSHSGSRAGGAGAGGGEAPAAGADPRDDPTCIEHVLDPENEEAYDLFKQFVAAEFSSENVLFIEDARLYKQMCSGHLPVPADGVAPSPEAAEQRRSRIKAAELIFSRYFSPRAALPVNVSDEVRRAVEAAYSQGLPTTFDSPIQHVKSLLSMDSFRRFAKTQAYLDYLVTLEDRKALIAEIDYEDYEDHDGHGEEAL